MAVKRDPEQNGRGDGERNLPASGIPARGYSWEPFAAGHTLTLRHGAFSPRTIDPLAAELIEGTIAEGGYLAEPDYRPAVEAWARAEARCILIDAWLQERGLLDAKGRPHPAAEYALRLERLAAEHRSRLGLDPRSRAALGKDVSSTGVDLARLMAASAERDGGDEAGDEQREETPDDA